MSKNGADMKQAMMMMGDCVLGAAVLIVLGVFGGAWLDGKLHSAPLWTICLSLLGGGLGLARLVIKALHLEHRGGDGPLPPALEDDDDDAGVAAYKKDAPSGNAGASATSSSADSARRNIRANPRSAYDFLEQEDHKSAD
jgi:F0F1-type ATP synthase assembly protein I